MSNKTSQIANKLLTTGMANKEAAGNGLWNAATPSMLLAMDEVTTALLVWGYIGGIWKGISIASGTVTLTASSTCYVVMAEATGVVSVSTGTTNWGTDTSPAAGYIHLYKIIVGTTAPSDWFDHRAGWLF